MMITSGIRLSHRKQHATSILRITTIAVGAAMLVCAASLSAQTASPSNLENARAEEFTISKVTVLDTESPYGTVSTFSRDGKWLAFLKACIAPNELCVPKRLVIVSVPGGEHRKSFDFPEPIASITWSADGTRLFAISTVGVGFTVVTNGFILDIAAAKIVSLGAVSTADGEMVWADARSVYFIGKDNRGQPIAKGRLDLETLSLSGIANVDSALATAAKLGKMPLDHPYVTLGTMSVMCTYCVNSNTAIAAFNRDDSYTRVLIPNLGMSEYHLPVTFSPDALYAVIGKDRQLLLLTMGTRKRPRLAVKATLLPLPDPIKESDLIGIRTSVLGGERVFADVFRPHLNPLNNRVVGTIGTFKGRVRISRLGDDGSIDARFVYEVDGYPEIGDVLQNFFRPGADQDRFTSVSAVVKSLTDAPTSRSVTSRATNAPPINEVVAGDPAKTVLDAFDAYIAGNTTGVTSLMSDEGARNTKALCPGDAATCLRKNYGSFGSLESRSAEIILHDAGNAKVRLMSNWQKAGSPAANVPQCQTYDLSLSGAGWRIDSFSWPVPKTCR